MSKALDRQMSDAILAFVRSVTVIPLEDWHEFLARKNASGIHKDVVEFNNAFLALLDTMGEIDKGTREGG